MPREDVVGVEHVVEQEAVLVREEDVLDVGVGLLRLLDQFYQGGGP